MLGRSGRSHRRSVRTVTLACLSGLLFGVTAGTAVAGDQTSPFEGTVVQHVSGIVGRCGPAKDSTVLGVGTAELKVFGHAVATASNCNDPSVITGGRFLLRFKDGSSIRGTYHGTVTKGLAISETLTITGGTKRFAGARGSAKGSGTEDLKALVSKLHFSGSITYPR
jgi:hypothetical protein